MTQVELPKILGVQQPQVSLPPKSPSASRNTVPPQCHFERSKPTLFLPTSLQRSGRLVQ